MNYETIKQLKDSDFKRLTGVQRETFDMMLKVIEKGLRDFGRPPKLSRADQLLMTLMYWREYRTEFHIAQSYGVSEATVCRTIRKVADAGYQGLAELHEHAEREGFRSAHAQLRHEHSLPIGGRG